MTDFHLRDARPADAPIIAAMWRELMALHAALDPRFTVAADGETVYRRHIEEMIHSRDGRVLIAEATETGEAVGYMLGEIHHRSPLAAVEVYGLISDVFVAAAWRQRGIGRALFEEIRRWFTDRRVPAIQLYVAVENPEALAFWQAVGMRPYMHVLQMDLPLLSSPASSPGEEDRAKQPGSMWRGLFRAKPRERGL